MITSRHICNVTAFHRHAILLGEAFGEITAVGETNGIHHLGNTELTLGQELGKESGIAFSADNGALIYSEKEDVCGVMHQVCQYPFYVVYRTASDKERQKLSVQKFLDNLGKWICREPVIINGSETRLNAFPELSQGRVIKRITRDNSYGLEPQESGVQDWLLPLSVRYENTYEVI